MKVKVIVLVSALLVTLFTGCAKSAPPASPNPSATKSTQPDTVTTASIVDNADAFVKAIGTNGTWIICPIKDLTVNKDLVLEGEYKNGKKDANGKDVIQRKIGLYAQDDKRNITARYTLTAPKLTINSPEASIEHGTFKGDLYVSAKNFKLIDAKIDGNVYYTNDEAKATVKIDEKSTVTGKQELKK
jgi:hypothetical protein